jgi:hypothetical protein
MLFQVNSKQAVLLPHWYTVPVPLCHHVHHHAARAWHALQVRPQGKWTPLDSALQGPCVVAVVLFLLFLLCVHTKLMKNVVCKVLILDSEFDVVVVVVVVEVEFNNNNYNHEKNIVFVHYSFI